MKKVLVRTALFLLVLSAGAVCKADPATDSVTRMKKELGRCVQTVDEWRSESRQQIVLGFAIGLAGIVVGALQGVNKSWVKGATVGLGLAISILTLATKTFYPADSLTLRRAISQAQPSLRDLSHVLDQVDPKQSPQALALIEADFYTKSDKIDQLGIKLLGVEPTHLDASLFRGATVYAQSQPKGPSWPTEGPYADKTGTYFVGRGVDSALSIAQTNSRNDAIQKAARWLKGEGSQNSSEASQQLVDLVRHSGEFVDTWFEYDRVKQQYRYLTRFRLPTRLGTIDVQSMAVSYRLRLLSVTGIGDMPTMKLRHWTFHFVANGEVLDFINYLHPESRGKFENIDVAADPTYSWSIPASDPIVLRVEALGDHDKVYAQTSTRVPVQPGVPFTVIAQGQNFSIRFEFVVKQL
jgi:hypothetical protein